MSEVIRLQEFTDSHQKQNQNSRIIKIPGADSIKKKISLIYNSDEKQKHEKVAKVIMDNLINNANFINVGYSLLKVTSGQIFKISQKERDLSAFLDLNYGINSAFPAYKYIIAAINTICTMNNKLNICYHFYYKTEDNVIFIMICTDRILICSENGIKEISNASNGIFFNVPDEFMPIKYNDSQLSNKWLIWNCLIKGLNCPSGDIRWLDDEELTFLMEIYLFFILFSQSMATRPILLVIAGRNSGKSSFLKKIGIILFGSEFKVSLVPKSRRDLETELINNILCCFDNADRTFSQTFKDTLAATSTGSGIKNRKLYTDSTQQRYSPLPNIAITTRKCPFSAEDDDIIQRSIIIKFKEVQELEPENSQMNVIIKNRDEIISQMIKKIPSILTALKEESPIAIDISFRMADFASFATKAAFPIFMDRYSKSDILDLLKKIFGKLIIAQNELMGNYSLHYIIDHYVNEKLNSHTVKTSFSVTSNDLYKELLIIDKDKNFGFSKEFSSVISFGRQMEINETIFSKRYGYTRIRKTGNKMEHTFNHINPDPLEL